MEMEEIARWTLVAAVIFAIVMGLVVGTVANNAPFHTEDTSYASVNAYVTLTMLILGIAVGLISATSKQATPFLVAAIALVVVAGTSTVWSPILYEDQLNLLYYWATQIVYYVAALAAPAAVIIAVRSLLAPEKPK
jgi:ABC-type transport system involved in multi-copper enzyme maturation permease subunit